MLPTISYNIYKLIYLSAATVQILNLISITTCCVNAFTTTTTTTINYNTHRNFQLNRNVYDPRLEDVYESDVPLILIPGMKGTHLSHQTEDATSDDYDNNGINNKKSNTRKKHQRAWLTFGNLVNFPPRPDNFPMRSLALPLTYDNNNVQDRGPLRPDGIVESILEFQLGDDGKRVNEKEQQQTKFQFFPFYGQAAKFVQDPVASGRKNVAVFTYDWRRSLDELADELEAFCDAKFPGRECQVVAHSMGGLLSYAVARRRPEKFRPGIVMVGVPFGTGIQYFQDLHRGYYSEINRCRQFLPESQFTMSSHWSFFPMNEEEASDLFIDISGKNSISFVPDKSAIGNPGTIFQDTVDGVPIAFDYYNVEDWERLQVGVFDPSYNFDDDKKERYRNHMIIQLEKARKWRETVYEPLRPDETFPPLVVAATDKIPTINQILRRVRKYKNSNTEKIIDHNKQQLPILNAAGKVNKCDFEYDYTSGRSVPGDGRIDFDKSFPPQNTKYKKVALSSMHAKQFCWEENGGSWGKIWQLTVRQIKKYHDSELKEAEEEYLNAENMSVINLTDEKLKLVNLVAVENTNEARSGGVSRILKSVGLLKRRRRGKRGKLDKRVPVIQTQTEMEMEALDQETSKTKQVLKRSRHILEMIKLRRNNFRLSKLRLRRRRRDIIK